MENNKEYHVQQLAKTLCSLTANRGCCETCPLYEGKDCQHFRTAELLYNKGFRQTEEPTKGKWIFNKSEYYNFYRCSFCNDWVLQPTSRCLRCYSPMDMEVEL